VADNSKRETNKPLIIRLVAIIGGMFLFAYALVPLYNVFCDITGINGKTRGQALYNNVEIDKQRVITVEFLTNVNRGMPWEFRPLVKSIQVHPGELNEVQFYAKNRSKQDIVGQSIPSISPGEAALYLNKTECFCFDQQRLKAGEEVDMVVKFYLDADIPEDINRLTLSYQLFNVSDSFKFEAAASK